MVRYYAEDNTWRFSDLGQHLDWLADGYWLIPGTFDPTSDD